jgi:polygalacturonase
MKKRDARPLPGRLISPGIVLPIVFCSYLLAGLSVPVEAGWDQVDEILSRIKAPHFPKRDFTITDYGAVADNKSDCTDAFRRAITAAHDAGGGRVVVPPGSFMTGPIHLKSNVNLYLSDGAIVNFSVDPKKYMPVVLTRYEGIECMNYSPLIYAYEQENVAITGQGILNGQASDQNWWRWKRTQGDDVKRLGRLGEQGIPVAQRVFGAGAHLRPNMIQPYKCRNVLIEGVTIKNSPMWHIHPVLSTNVIVRNVRVIGHGPNNDGCDPESCSDVLIDGCSFDTGDDCIAIKAGRNNDGRRVNAPSENIIIRNCRMKDGHGGVVIGSETTGGIWNVFAENCTMDSPHLDRALRIKSNSIRGGFIENIYLRNIKIGQVADAVLRINLQYGEGDIGDFTPTIRNINMENVTSGKSKYALYIDGYARAPVTGIHLTNCTFDNVKKPDVVRGAMDLTLTNVKVNGKLRKDTGEP